MTSDDEEVVLVIDEKTPQAPERVSRTTSMSDLRAVDDCDLLSPPTAAITAPDKSKMGKLVP